MNGETLQRMAVEQQRESAASDGRAHMRVMIVNAALYIGGAENVTATLCRGLDRRRFDVVVVHLRGNGQIARELEDEGYHVIALPPGRSERDYGTSLRLRRIVSERQIDLVHSHDLHTLVDCAICAATLSGVRHVSTLHYGNHPRADLRSRLLEGLFVRAPHRVVAVGEAQRQAIARTYRLDPARLTLIRNGVADARAAIDPSGEERIRRGAPLVIGSVSTLIEQKGLDHLLQAARLLADRGVTFRLVIVGDGPLKESMEELARELGLGAHVEFLGWIEDGARRVLPWIDVFVQSSRWEAMSMVVLEAMSSGAPIVATTVGDNPYVIRDGESGFLVPPAQPRALADRLQRLLEDEELRTRFSAAARRDYEERYTAARMCAEYAGLYEEAMAGRRGGQRTGEPDALAAPGSGR